MGAAGTKGLNRAVVALLVVVCAAIVATNLNIDRLARSVDRLVHTVEKQAMIEPGELYASWYSAGTPPVLQEVKTIKRAGESTADWIARHDADVALKRTLYPPI